MKIKDITTHSQRDKERAPTIYEVSSEHMDFKYKVHRHIYCPGTWLLTAKELGLDMYDLETDDSKEALSKALAVVSEYLDRKISFLQMARQEILEYTGVPEEV